MKYAHEQFFSVLTKNIDLHILKQFIDFFKADDY